MWFIAIVLLCVNGVMGGNICENAYYKVCIAPFTSEIPGTANELEELCPLTLKYFDCLKNYENTCKNNGPQFRNGEYESIRSIIVDVCSNGTALHTAVFENIKCIKHHFQNSSDECNKEGFQVVNALEDFQKTAKRQEEVPIASMKRECLFFIYDVGCYMSSASTKCGPVTKQAIIDIINRSYLLRSQCTIEALNELKSIANSLNISDAQKSILNESLRKLN